MKKLQNIKENIPATFYAHSILGTILRRIFTSLPQVILRLKRFVYFNNYYDKFGQIMWGNQLPVYATR
jgi:hypothetical protein